MRKNKALIIDTMMIISILILVAVTDFLSLNYWVKSAIKIALFFMLPILLMKIDHQEISIPFKSSKTSLMTAGLLSIGTIVVIVGGYFLTQNIIDYTNIPQALEDELGVTKHNFMWVFFYIPLVNAFLEEYFFRHYLHRCYEKSKTWIIIFISATLFSIYHVAILNTWVDIWVIVAAILALLAVGILFSYIRVKTKSMLPTYLMHASANLGINIAALFILGMI